MTTFPILSENRLRRTISAVGGVALFLTTASTAPACDVVSAGEATVVLTDGGEPIATRVDLVVLRAGDDNRVTLEATGEGGASIVLRAERLCILDRAGSATGELIVSADGVCVSPVQPKVRIGVVTEPVSAALAAQLVLDDAAIVITEVTAGLSAERAGLQQWDVVTHVEGALPVTQESLRDAVQAARPGDVIRLRIVRGAQPMEIEVTVEAAAEESAVQSALVLATLAGVEPSPAVTYLARPMLQDVTYSTLNENLILTSRLAQVVDHSLIVEPRLFTLSALLELPGAAAEPAEQDPTARLRAEIEALKESLARIEALLGELAGDE